MSLTSIVIPSRNEQFLNHTVRDLLANATGEIEIIVVLEGYWPDEVITEDRVSYVHFTEPRGMRGAINAGAAVARGEYLMKCDAHCAFGEGFDTILADGLAWNEIAIPTRYSLDAENWCRKRKKPINDMYLCAPTDPNDYGGPSLHGRTWGIRQNDPARVGLERHDLMSAQGSVWFMHRAYFDHLGLLDDVNYGHFCYEFQEIGLACWLTGGRVIRDRRTWYAHLHKGAKYGRGWHLGRSVLDKGAAYVNGWLDRRMHPRQDRDIRWLVRHFWPVPTWTEEMVRLVFWRRRGGSGEIRGTQIGAHLLARVNPEWTYEDDVHVWVKQQPRDLGLPGKHYLDVLDEHRRIPWLKAHPECGVIASSATGKRYLEDELGRYVYLIPQHHANYEREARPERPVKVAGVIGGRGALQCDVDALEAGLAAIGVELRWCRHYTTREDVVAFYRDLDVQLVWRRQQRPLKNPMKAYNAASFGIPTVGYPEIGYTEWEGNYTEVTTVEQMVEAVRALQVGGWDAGALIRAAEPYHIDNVAPLYRGLLA
jgi:glycosyltransferase involved in cell wall biosynthesis